MRRQGFGRDGRRRGEHRIRAVRLGEYRIRCADGEGKQQCVAAGDAHYGAGKDSENGAPIPHPTGPARRCRGVPAGAASAIPAGPAAQFAVSRHSHVAATERLLEPAGLGFPN
ncbi:hypothetical protein RPSB_37200 (plasmid) [Ralstonia solanacearum]|nr:hypothetical protein MAFF241648_38310 [Ralstonia solanacearum]BCN06583.1 hypothetical protein RPSB_37200 [Ralstonia solanacearum]